ncbi:MAG: sensor histidine kinase, partial [Bosea sp. (in: a-proteobacteria)]
KAVAARVGGARRLLSIDAMPPDVARTTDLRDSSWMMSIKEAVDVLLMPAGAMPIRVLGSAMGEADFVELIIDERPLRQAMLGFSWNILLLSLFISALTAALVYLALHLMIVHPIRRLSRGIVEFEKDPENPRQIIIASNRKDEIGDAERALARMEMTLADELRAKKRLAALGLAVSKVNHDLRNMLAAAQLMSDQLSDTTDTKVQRFAPRLIATLGRAIDFCQSTLAYGRATEAPPALKPVNLRQLVADSAELLGLLEGALQPPQMIVFQNNIPREAKLTCDPDQMARVVLNLMRNAVQALTQAGSESGLPQLSVELKTGPGITGFCIVDNGPGVPMRAQAHLFEAFRGSVRAGGTGLGLAIAAELVGLHGGTIALEPSTSGARFSVTLPLTGTKAA